jgi:DivIVA domain-containing protein
MAFTPEEIQGKEFFITLRGYDKDEVRSFLAALAEEHERLLRVSEATAPSEVSFESLGRGVGSVLEAAHKASEEMRKEAEVVAHELTQSAAAEAAQMKEEAAAKALEVAEEAERLSVEKLTAATARAEDIQKESEGMVVAWREEADRVTAEQREAAAREVKEAERRALETREAAEAEVKAATRRVQRLQRAESKLRQELEGVHSELRLLLEEMGRPELHDEVQEGRELDPSISAEPTSMPASEELAPAQVAHSPDPGIEPNGLWPTVGNSGGNDQTSR